MPKIFDSLTQSDFTDHEHGHLEAVVVRRDAAGRSRLWHYWRDNAPIPGTRWHLPEEPIIENVAGAASLIQSTFHDEDDEHGHLELVVPMANPDETNDLWHFWRDSSGVWHRNEERVAANVAEPGSLKQTDFTDDDGHGHLEVVVPVANADGSMDLRRLWHDSSWHGSSTPVAERVAGPGSLIHSLALVVLTFYAWLLGAAAIAVAIALAALT